jgi:gliding motility-associated-like protein
MNTPNTQWLWNTGATTSSIFVGHPGIYSVRVTVDGCSTNDTIEIAKDCYLDIPNAFTPNGDDVDDYFIPRNLLSKGLNDFSMKIYNRWGQVIFETNKINGRGWDGKFNGQDQPMEVYIYDISIAFKNNVHENYRGNVTLIR